MDRSGKQLQSSSIGLLKIEEINLEKLVGLITRNVNKGPWTFEEKIELIKIINSLSPECKFMKRSIVLDYKNKDSIMYKNNLSDKDQKAVQKGYKKKTSTVHFYKEFEISDIVDLFIDSKAVVPKDNISWIDVCKKFLESQVSSKQKLDGKVRTYIDCRIEWKNILYPALTQTSFSDRRADLKILNYIIENELEVDDEIDFKSIENGRSNLVNKSRWNMLIKYFGSAKIPNKTFEKAQALKDILKSKQRRKPVKVEIEEPYMKMNILEFYKNNY